jgi:hypothetical protein
MGCRACRTRHRFALRRIGLSNDRGTKTTATTTTAATTEARTEAQAGTAAATATAARTEAEAGAEGRTDDYLGRRSLRL